VKKYSIALVFLCSLIAVSCGDDSSEAVDVSGLLTEAASYLGTSIPDFGNTVGSRTTPGYDSRRAIEFITPSKWSSATSGDHISPPGGVVSSPGDEPTYGGATLPALVNYRDFMKMALDPEFKRSSDGRTYRPTVFGRFDSLVEILGYMQQAGVSVDGSGLPAVGSYNVSLTLPERATTVRIIAEISATANTTYYDRRVDLIGFNDANGNTALDNGEQLMINNLMWIRANASALNFMMIEQRESSRRGRAINHGSLNVLKWDRTTGKFQFEYVSVPSDSVTNGNLEIFRAYVESTDGKTYAYGFTGKADQTLSPADYLQYALYAPTSGTTEGTVSLRELRTDSDVWQGNICATFTTGVGAVGDTTGDSEPASGGTCAGQAADALNTKAGIMGFANGIRNATVWTAPFDDKGFPATAKPDWSVAADRAAWLVAGDTVSVSFSDRTGFIAAWDGTP